MYTYEPCTFIDMYIYSTVWCEQGGKRHKVLALPPNSTGLQVRHQIERLQQSPHSHHCISLA